MKSAWYTPSGPLAVIAAALLLVPACRNDGATAPAAPASALRIYGHVAEWAGRDVGYSVRVSIIMGSHLGQETQTDGGGNYELTGLPAGSDVIQALSTRFRDEGDVQSVTITSDTRIDLLLQPSV